MKDAASSPRHDRGRPRERIRRWYSRHGGDRTRGEFAATVRHKLYQNRDFFDVENAPLERSPRSAKSPEEKAPRHGSGVYENRLFLLLAVPAPESSTFGTLRPRGHRRDAARPSFIKTKLFLQDGGIPERLRFPRASIKAFPPQGDEPREEPSGSPPDVLLDVGTNWFPGGGWRAVGGILLSLGFLPGPAPPPPPLHLCPPREPKRPVFISEERLAILRQRIQAGVDPNAAAFRKMKGEVDRNLDREPRAPRHWHVPSYYRDAVGHRKAKEGLQEDANLAYQAALCHRMTGDERYAKAALRLIEAWSTQLESTSDQDDSTLSFSYHFPAMIFGADLLRASRLWTEESRRSFDRFLADKALPLNTMKARNNWGNWGLVLVLAVAAWRDDPALLEKGASRWKEFIQEQITDQGHLHHEVTRNNGRGEHGIWYSHFSLMPQTIAAEILRVNGTDLYEYHSPQGRTMRQAFHVLAGWSRRPSTFAYFKGDPKGLVGTTYFSYFEILNPRWPNADATALLAEQRPMTATHSAPALTFTHGDLPTERSSGRRP